MPDAKTSATKTVTDATFADEVLLSEKPVLVDFWAAWCGPCKMVAPVLEEIAAANADKITIAKLDADNNPESAKHYGILSLPTMVLFQGGKETKRIVGAKGKAALLRELEEVLYTRLDRISAPSGVFVLTHAASFGPSRGRQG